MKLAPQVVDICQVFGPSPKVMTDMLKDGVNLAVWQRQLPAQVEDFCALVLSLGQTLADERVIDVDEQHPPQLPGLLREAADLHGYEGFVADVAWLVRPTPACSVHGASVCACGYWMARCARASMWITCRCACSPPMPVAAVNGWRRV